MSKKIIASFEVKFSVPYGIILDPKIYAERINNYCEQHNIDSDDIVSIVQPLTSVTHVYYKKTVEDESR